MTAKHAQELEKTYRTIAQGYEEVNTSGPKTPELVENLQLFTTLLDENSHVLDLGAGNGSDSKLISDAGHKVTLFDLSPEMLEIAKTKVPNGTFVIGDMTDLPFETNTFDGIWSNFSLLHVTKKEAATVLSKLYEVTKENGLVYILVKAGEGETIVEDDKYGVPMKRFFSFYRLEELENMFVEARFKIEKSGEINTSFERSNLVYVLARKAS